MLTNQSVLIFVDIVLFAIALGLLLPSTVLFVECSAALVPDRCETRIPRVFKHRLAVLVPAHNEAAGIGVTLESLLAQLASPNSIVVIADNCSDETAAIARTFGVKVIERQDLERRGKGYALDYGLQFLAVDPPEAVVVVDADCIVHQGTIARIAGLAVARKQPVQATYLMAQPTHPGTKDSISALAVIVKNLVRPSGLMRLGLPCLLTGTGMAFPWSVISKVSLASSNIVEDMQLAVELAIAGHQTLFCLDAKVTGCLPKQEAAAKGQRTRWEHGHLRTLLTQVPELLKASIRQQRLDLLALALDLCVPPLSLFVLIWTIALGGALLAGASGASWIPAICLAIEGIFIFVSILGAWAKFGRNDLPMLTLLAVPFYIMWKIPIYLAFLIRPQTKWVRTARDT